MRLGLGVPGRSVGHGGVSAYGTFLSVKKRVLDPRGRRSRASKSRDLGRFMAAFGRRVAGAWPRWHSAKAGDGRSVGHWGRQKNGHIPIDIY